MLKKIKNITYNVPQLAFLFTLAKIILLEWGRGTGKSTILGRRIIDCVTQMPRSTGVIAAQTYAQIKTRTLPSTIQGLEQHGIYKDIHFFVGKRPPKSWNWPEPYEPPLDYKNSIIFWNGTVINFISQDASGASGRGLNVDWVISDEAGLLDEKKFETDVLLTNRGNLKRIAHYPDGTWKYFEDCPLHHSIVLATSTPVTVAGRWILKYEDQALKHPEKVCFIRASALDNKHNLGIEYFLNAKRIMPDFLYRAEVLNIRIPRIDNGFYPKLSETKHTYQDYDLSYFQELALGKDPDCRGDSDLDGSRELIAGIDWGVSINCMVIGQGDSKQFKALNNIYVKSPQIVDDLIDEFVKYYKHHAKKVLHLWYDPTGNLKTATSRKTTAEQVRERLTKKGWRVQLMTQGVMNELHENKYNLWNNILKEEEGENYPKFSMNMRNCKELWISMSNAPAKIGLREAIKKDKSSERNKSVDQAHATHFSDAMDVIIVGMYKDRLFSNSSGSVAEPILM